MAKTKSARLQCTNLELPAASKRLGTVDIEGFKLFEFSIWFGSIFFRFGRTDKCVCSGEGQRSQPTFLRVPRDQLKTGSCCYFHRFDGYV